MREPQTAQALAWAVPMPPEVRQSKGVGGKSVYALFFHGPAFQVVGRSWLDGDALWCELQAGLPPLTGDPNENLWAAAQWIELCLQAAGLLEVAKNSRMMIPYRIEGIDFLRGDKPDGEQVFAVARKSDTVSNAVLKGGGGESGTDIDLVDARGKLLVRVRNYQTCPLPFASDQDALARLALEFHSDWSSAAESVAASGATPFDAPL